MARTLTPQQVATAAAFGTAIEFYDFFLYTFIAATVFGPLFFPAFHPWLGTLAALSTHATAFLVRPGGALLFGWIGDRHGRRPALVGSLALMGVATVGVGLLPTYTTIGIAAPILLVALRLLQGMALGGEAPGAFVVAVEHAPTGRRTFYGAFGQIGIALGILLVGLLLLAVTIVVGEQTFQDWGWRVAFLFSAILVIFGIALRTRLAETPEFIASSTEIDRERSRPGQLKTLWRQARPSVVIGTLIWIAPVTFAYAFLTSIFVYVKSYVPNLPTSGVQVGLVLAASVLVVVTTVSAYFGDRWGRERSIIVSGVWTILWAAPAYWLVGRSSLPALWLAMTIGAVAYGIASGVAPSLTSDLFPVTVRYVGVAIAITVSVIIGGAALFLPAIALVGATGGSVVPVIVMMILAGVATTVGGVLAIRTRETGPGKPDPSP